MLKTIHYFKNYISVLFLVAYIFSIAGCRYQMVKKSKLVESETSYINDVSTNFYMVHLGDEIWQLSEVTVTKNDIRGKLSELNPHAEDLFKNFSMKNYNSKIEIDPSMKKYSKQIHIYTDKFIKDGEYILLTDNEISRIDVYKSNSKSGKIIGVIALVGVGIVGGIYLISAIICNCPHVYVYDGEFYKYNNTLFTGAASKTLEREDIKIMPDYFPQSKEYNFYIKNEDKETQFINSISLIVAEHDKTSEVYSDQKGNFYEIKELINPKQALSDGGEDFKLQISSPDEDAFRFDNQTAKDYSHLYVTFDKPDGVKDAKLVLRLKNDKWGGFVYNEFSKKFGRYYDNWVKNNSKKSKEEVESNMKKAGIPLVLSMKVEGKWQDIETIQLVGDINYNTIVVPINKDLISDKNIEFRIRSGFMFWELDYLAMDFSQNEKVKINTIKPVSVTTNNSIDNLPSILNRDQQYLKHEKYGDSTIVKFTNLPVSSNLKRSVFLQSEGYYIPEKNFEGKMKYKELKEFENEGELSRFSKKLYNSLSKPIYNN